ncbi:hypothetical protein DENSPDRAFT_841051 [Dentipellis sp. KUC8613]|nr:hypothetical protein DENSPDRAFT_841051 [Dentipellis sp. KUC8613]
MDLGAEVRNPPEPSVPDQFDYARILWNPIIIDSVFAYSTPRTLIRLSWACKRGLAAARSYLPRAFDIHQHLARFFTCPPAFRALQARTGLLVSGSSALQFLDRTFYPNSDFDAYVSIEHVREVARWLEADGYAFAPKERQRRDVDSAVDEAEETRAMMEDAGLQPGIYSMRGVIAVFDFVKPTAAHTEADEIANADLDSNSDSNSDSDSDSESTPLLNMLKVQIIAALDCAIEPILNFHCSASRPEVVTALSYPHSRIRPACVMNIISHAAAYSLYPTATFEARVALAFPRNQRRIIPALQKYADRGWTIVHDDRAAYPTSTTTTTTTVAGATTTTTTVTTTTPGLACLAPGARWTNDVHAWVLPLPPVSPSAHDPVAHTNWQLMYTRPPSYAVARHPQIGQTPRMVYHLVGSRLLRGVYVLADELLLLAVWGALRGVRIGMEEMRKVLEFQGLEDLVEETPSHDGVVYVECKAYREAMRSGRLPNVLWKRWPQQRFLML